MTHIHSLWHKPVLIIAIHHTSHIKFQRIHWLEHNCATAHSGERITSRKEYEKYEMQISDFNNVSKNVSNINPLRFMTVVYMPLLNVPDVSCHNHLLHDA